MYNNILIVRNSLAMLSNIGSCMYCMRKSFIALFLSVIFLGLAFFINTFHHFKYGVIFSVTLSVCLACLWVLHLLVYSLHRTRDSAKTIDSLSIDYQKRKTVGIFFRALSTAVVITTFPRLASAGRYGCSFDDLQTQGLYRCGNQGLCCKQYAEECCECNGYVFCKPIDNKVCCQ